MARAALLGESSTLYWDWVAPRNIVPYTMQRGPLQFWAASVTKVGPTCDLNLLCSKFLFFGKLLTIIVCPQRSLRCRTLVGHTPRRRCASCGCRSSLAARRSVGVRAISMGRFWVVCFSTRVMAWSAITQPERLLTFVRIWRCKVHSLDMIDKFNSPGLPPPAFPFVNAQIIAFFSLCVIFIYPLLYVSFVNKLWFACFLNSLTVLCSLGMHEVARELENPFTNVPNDLPLCTFQVRGAATFYFVHKCLPGMVQF